MHVEARVDAAPQPLTRLVVAQVSLDEMQQRVVDVALGAIPVAEMASLTTATKKGKPQTVIYTDARALNIDEAQYRADRGPCLDAWREQRTVRVDDVRSAEGSYASFARAALDHDVLSSLSLPLVGGTSNTGSLNLYAGEPEAFADYERAATGLADDAAVALANAAAYWAANEVTVQLQIAMQSRAVIEQAKGILMASDPSLTPDGAFDILRRASQRENLKLHDIAERIVRRQPPG